MIFFSGLGSSEIIQNLLKEAVDDSLTFYNLSLICKSNCQLPEDTYNGIIQRSILYAKLKGKTVITTAAPPAPSPVPVLTPLVPTPVITKTAITTAAPPAPSPVPVLTPLVSIPVITKTAITTAAPPALSPVPVLTTLVSTPFITKTVIATVAPPAPSPVPVLTPLVSTPVITKTVITSDIVYIGNPGKSQYPGNDNRSNLARCIWDMQYHKNRIYMSYGDSWNNQGPVYVWSIANNETAFKKETTLTEESCWSIREYDNKLYIPGTDATGDTSGNIYIKNDTWNNYPIYATHINDICPFNNVLYTTLARLQSQLFIKFDPGKNEKILFEFPSFNEGMIGSCLPFDDRVIFTTLEGWDANVYQCTKDDKITKLYKYTSRPSKPEIYRSTKYRNGYLCCFSYPLRLQYIPYPLYFLDLSGVTLVGFENSNVRDVIVRGNDVYILTAELKDNVFFGYIYYSTDLKSWTLLSSFQLSSMPTSMEYLDRMFYIGTTISNDLATSFEADSGNVYRIQAMSKSPTPLGILNLWG